MTRRRFIKLSFAIGGGTVIAGIGYSALEACWIQISNEVIRVPRLPSAFSNLRIAFLVDIHHGPFTSLAYVNSVVTLANNLNPDLILLGGDYVHRDRHYIAPCFQALRKLNAPLGVYGVLGNHDHWESAPETRKAMQDSEIVELTNEGIWLSQKGQRLRLAGVGDLWEDTQDLTKALGDTHSSETSILLSHNPDYVETITDSRVGLVLSGHTHSGQVIFPLIGAPIVPSRFGQKYLRGLVKTPYTQVFVSRGLGTITPPLRFCCRPEINIITLI